MTNPSNAVEKPATGCGCSPIGMAAEGRLCPEGLKLWKESEAAWRRFRRGKALSGEYRAASDAYRAHVEAVK